MDELVMISKQMVGSESVDAVDARELHGRLEVSTQFSVWIQRRIEDGQLVEGQDFVSYSNLNSSGQTSKEYALTLDAAKHIAMLERTTIGREVRQYFITYEKETKKALSRLALNFQYIEKEAAAALRLANLFGLEGNQAKLAAGKAMRKFYGQDPVALLEAAYPSEQQDLLLSVTELGRQADPQLSPVMTNKRLEAVGLQRSFRDKKGRLCWQMTEEGKQYGVYLDTGKKHSDGTPVQQVKWYKRVLEVL